jgi:hypothetical protein
LLYEVKSHYLGDVTTCRRLYAQNLTPRSVAVG